MSSSSSPCAACKLLRRKCTQGCVFAPYFPPDQPAKFANVHKVFGASNVTKLLNDLQPEQREDAVNSLAYEAEARLRDPVYGCVAYISILQLRIKQVQHQMAGLQVQQHPHHHQQMVNAQNMAAAVEVAREQDMDRMLRARHAAYAAHANAATVAVEAPGSLNADTFDGGPFLLQQQPPSSAQTEPAMALPYLMEPSPPQPSSGHSHDECIGRRFYY
ncbi:hypothetical protein E2562_020670 [Oryza meyeriana var. granulata]|uniref:LOB domain-containing protein n=1 Tax=Oryza meyeriana var. granulata TaxID=110450 RepID=A0A6G1EBL9_9ORYZ|nr:hypothetical protein E2562_020670 [Oryza meyeriana var. granulata]KAF0921987.1 hypothetical protein E2562_020670 [Oryza meyeriana var. granulata]